MYSIGQQVVYGMHGVCTVVALEDQVVDRRTISYYVLEPLDNPVSRYYLPSQNASALSKIRPLMSRQALLDCWQQPLQNSVWIPEENRRKQAYRQMLSISDTPTLVHMFRCLEQYRRQQHAAGKKFHLSDENFLRDLRKVLLGEMVVVLAMDSAQADDYIDQLLDE